MYMTVKECATLTGASEAWVRSACKRGGVLGDAWAESKRKKRMTYEVSPGKVAEWLGITAEELERRVDVLPGKRRDEVVRESATSCV